MTEERDLGGVAAFCYEVGYLKQAPRSGWLRARVRAPESVAEHSHRTAVLAYLIAHLEGADAERACTLAAWHDVPETRTTDLDSIAKRHVSAEDPTETAKLQTTGFPDSLGQAVREIIGEVEAKASRESICAKDADKLECLITAREYQTEGYTDLEPWVENMAASMRTETGKQLAGLAQELRPRCWWDEIVSSYGLPTAGTALNE